MIEADHDKLKRRIKPTLGFKSMKTAYATIKGFELMHHLRQIAIAYPVLAVPANTNQNDLTGKRRRLNMTHPNVPTLPKLLEQSYCNRACDCHQTLNRPNKLTSHAIEYVRSLRKEMGDRQVDG